MLIIEHAVNDIIMTLIIWQALASRAKKDDAILPALDCPLYPRPLRKVSVIWPYNILY